MACVKQISSKAEFDDALKSKDVVLVDFYADWCGPCKQMAPKIQKFAEEYVDMGFFKMDVDEAEESVVTAYKVEALPTFIIFKNGTKVTEIIGANAKKVQDALEACK